MVAVKGVNGTKEDSAKLPILEKAVSEEPTESSSSADAKEDEKPMCRLPKAIWKACFVLMQAPFTAVWALWIFDCLTATTPIPPIVGHVDLTISQYIVQVLLVLSYTFYYGVHKARRTKEWPVDAIVIFLTATIGVLIYMLVMCDQYRKDSKDDDKLMLTLELAALAVTLILVYFGGYGLENAYMDVKAAVAVKKAGEQNEAGTKNIKNAA